MSRPLSHAFRSAVVARAIVVGDEQAAREFQLQVGVVKRWRMRTTRSAGQPPQAPTQEADKSVSEAGAARERHATAFDADTPSYTVHELAALYTDAGLSTTQLAALTGRAQSGISALLRRHGVQMRSVREGVALRRGGSAMHGRVPPTIIVNLLDRGMSITGIAATLGVSASTVQWHRDHPPGPPRPRPAPMAGIEPANPNRTLPDQSADAIKAGFAANLTLLRGIHDLTSAALSRLIGLSPQALSEWRSGRQHPGWRALSTISDFFSVPVDLLVNGSVTDMGRYYFADEHYQDTERRIRAAHAAGSSTADRLRDKRSPSTPGRSDQ